MEVLDNILYFKGLFSQRIPEGEATGEYAAIISIPGAVISGCNVYQIYVGIREVILLSKVNHRERKIYR